MCRISSSANIKGRHYILILMIFEERFKIKGYWKYYLRAVKYQTVFLIPALAIRASWLCFIIIDPNIFMLKTQAYEKKIVKGSKFGLICIWLFFWVCIERTTELLWLYFTVKNLFCHEGGYDILILIFKAKDEGRRITPPPFSGCALTIKDIYIIDILHFIFSRIKLFLYKSLEYQKWFSSDLKMDVYLVYLQK